MSEFSVTLEVPSKQSSLVGGAERGGLGVGGWGGG